ncbi:hypothetical protein LUZ60_017090 [Juncus effusus]|nr:hypothetical protein LUZ60_017090 [Juncus effusus]
MEKRKAMALFLLVALFSGFCSASALSPARVARRFLSNIFYALLKRLWSLAPATKGVVSGRTGMKFESGYNIETVFDGTKSGIEPHSITLSPDGDILILDSANSNIYTISPPLSKYSRPKLFAGSAEGSTGHVDGRLREARLNQPKGFTTDERGNIYIADTLNRAIRKISDLGITTIACEEAKLSNDFEVVYASSSCSLLIVDRGNQNVREIFLSDDDCAFQYISSDFPFGVLVIVLSIIFGYLLGFLHRKLVSNDATVTTRENNASHLQQYQQQQYVRPFRPPPTRVPLIPPNPKKQQELQPMPLYTSSPIETNHTLPPVPSTFPTMFPLLGSIFSAFKRKKPIEPPTPIINQFSNQQHISHGPGAHGPGPVKLHRVKGARSAHREVELPHHRQQQYVQRHRQYGPGPQTCYESNNSEVVFGAVQEDSDRKGSEMDIRPINYGDPFYEQTARFRRNQLRF